MKLVSVEQTKLTIPEVADMAQEEAVILTRNGKPLAVIKDLSGEDWESVSLANDPQFRRVIEKSRQDYRKRGGVALDEVRRELDLE